MQKYIFKYFNEIGSKDKPWLIVGKGKSFDGWKNYNLNIFNILTLNHVCKIIKPTIAHFIDIDAYLDCYQNILDEDISLLMPEYPHINERPDMDKSLTNLVPVRSGLRIKEDQGRLYYYKLSTVPNEDSIKVHHFSAEAAFGILARNNVKKIFTLGIDGGELEAEEFYRDGRNRPVTYEPQMEHLEKIIKDNGIEWSKL